MRREPRKRRRGQASLEGLAEAYSKKVHSPTERGYQLELAYALGKSGDYDAADKIFSRLEKAYPEEFTFFFAHAGMKQRQGRISEAEKLASEALRYSYGDNRLR